MNFIRYFFFVLACVFTLILLSGRGYALPPTASFTADPASGAGAPVAVQFTDTSAGNPTSFLWDFGGGLTSTEQHPMAAFYLPGTYPITLTVANGTGSDAVTQEYVVVACSNLFSVMVENDGSAFDTIMGAYNSAVSLGLTNFTLMLKAGVVAEENLYFDADASVVLKGGYDCSFLNSYLVTTIPGSLTISADALGSVTASNITVSSAPSCSTDNDGDGHTAIGSCEGTADDCDDSNQQNFPGNTESCDGRDNDCDGQIDEGLSAVDADGDGYTAIGSCGSADDCNDNNANINPGATELYGDGIDQDCDGHDLLLPSETACFGCHDLYFTNSRHSNVGAPDGTCATCHAAAVSNALPGHYGRTVRTAGNNMPAGAIIGCTSCHDWHDDEYHTIPGANIVWDKVTAVGYANVTCDTCHEDRAAAHAGHHLGADNDVSYNPAADTSQASRQGCAACHRDYDMVNGTSLGLSTWVTILAEHDLDGAKDGSTNTCNNCHVYDGGSSAPLAAVQNAIAGGNPVTCATCHTDKAPDVDHGVPTSGKHPEHLAMAGVSCGNCHNTGSYPSFNSGTDLDGDNLYNLAETDVCSACHTNGAGGDPSTTDYKTAWTDPDAHLGCADCHGFPPAYASGTPKANSHGSPSHSSSTCDTCHYATTATGSTITDPSRHMNSEFDVEHGTGVSFIYDPASSTCSSISCHGNTSAQWGQTADCLGCHNQAMGARAAIGPQFSANSHHVQAGAATGDKCYQCHWEADSAGRLTSHHGGSTSPGSAVDLVIYGVRARPAESEYSVGTTAVSYMADGTRAQIQSLTTHCLGCHREDNNGLDIFGDGRSPNAYAWDIPAKTSIDERYSQTGTTPWGKYDGANVTPKNQRAKAYSAHGNTAGNQGGWDLSEKWPNTRNGAENVACFDCHNAHGSSVAGATTSYASATTNGGILKDTTLAGSGYAAQYKPVAGGAAETRDLRNAGASLCFDCHLTPEGGTAKPWGYQATFGASEAILGYWDSPFFGDGPFGSQSRYGYKALSGHQGGHFGASSELSDPATPGIGGLCTPCHDPHGVSTTLGADMQFGVPLLKGTWLTSPYREDGAPAQNSAGTAVREGVNYHIDQNTFGATIASTVTGVVETETQFAGLCLNCHQKSSLTDGETHAWQSKDRIHEAVKGWKTANGTVQHQYTCSKCHTPHNSRLPRLMVTSCLSPRHKGQMGANASPVLSGSGSGTMTWDEWGYPLDLVCEGDALGCSALWDGWSSANGSGSGRFPGVYSSSGTNAPGTVSASCHEGNAADQGWNVVTTWESQELPAPSLIDESLNGCDAACGVKLNWNAAVNPDGDPLQYEVEVDDTADFSSPIYASGWIPGVSVTTTPLNTSATYHWRVRTRDAVHPDILSSWAKDAFSMVVPTSPPAPTLIDEPESICALYGCSVTFQWYAVTAGDGDTAQYAVQVDDAPDFSSPDYSSGWVAGTSLTASLAGNKTYYWRVQARDAAHLAYVSDWSDSDIFKLVARPAAPVLVAEPDSVCEASCAATLEWNGVTVPDGHPAEYYVVVDDAANFGSPAFTSGWIPESAVTTPPLNLNITYHWRVKSRDAGHPAAESAYTALDSFILLSARPIPTYPTSIYSWSCSVPTSTYLAWSGNPGNQFQVTITDHAGTTHNSGWLPADRKFWYTPNLDITKRWYWQVQALNPATGEVSAWSDEVSYIYQETTCDSGSCPMLYTWDGTNFVYESDMFGTGKLGLPKGATSYIKPNPNDYYLLMADPVPNAGFLELRMVEERAETNYLDQITLYAAEVPEGKSIYAEIPKMEGAYAAPAAMLHTVDQELQHPLSITHVNTGADVSAKLAADDNDPLVLNEDQNLYDYQTLELDLGDLAGAPKVKLVINAVSAFPDTPEGQDRMKLFTAHTKLEVLDAGGSWVAVPAGSAFLAKPKEFRRTHLVDVTNAFVANNYRIRLTYLFKTYIDSIYFDTTADEPITLREVPLAAADLLDYGFSRRTESNGVIEYVYGDKVDKNMPVMPGDYTRFGEVNPLLGQTDDKFVIFGNGDEIQLRFDAPPPVPAGTTRRYLLYMNGYYKNWKIDTIPFTVEPMPFAAMSNFPYDETVEHYPDDADHNQYRAGYNTRAR